MYKKTPYYNIFTSKNTISTPKFNIKLTTVNDADIFLNYKYVSSYIHALIDPLKCIWPKDYTGQQNIEFLQNIKPITIYQPQSKGYVRMFQQLIDLYKKTELNNINCLAIGTIRNSLEAILLYNNIHNAQSYENKFAYFEIFYVVENTLFTKNAITELKRNFTFDEYLSPPFSNITDPKNLQLLVEQYKKTNINLICLTARMVGKYTYAMANQQLLFAEIVAALQILQQHGILTITTYNNSDEFLKQILFILCSSFEEVIILYPTFGSEINTPNIHCKNYDGKFDTNLLKIVEEWYKIDPLGGKFLNFKSAELRDKHNITRDFGPDDINTYVTSMFTTDYPKQFIEFFDLLLKHKKTLIDDLQEQMNMILKYENNIDNFQKIYNEHWNEILPANVAWAEQYGLEVQPQYKISAKEIEDKYLSVIYTADDELNSTFSKFRDVSSIVVPNKYDPDSRYYFDNLILKKKRVLYHRLAMDTRDWEGLKKLSYDMLPNKQIIRLIQSEYGQKNASRAFAKMYEILATYDILPKTDKLRSFHTCEAPGNFIAAITYFITTRTKITDYKWNSNSLNADPDAIKEYAKNTGRTESDAFGDNYGYIKEYPDRWLWGADNTGDITQHKNITNLVDNATKNLKDKILLFTSDCGIEVGYGLREQERNSAKLALSQATVALRVLSLGGNAVFKMFLPFSETITVNILYLLYTHFETISIQKQISGPPVSGEVYVIAQNLQSVMSDKMFDYICNVLDKFDPRAHIFPKDIHSDSFVLQLENILDQYINRYIDALNRIVFYYENPNIQIKHIKILREKNIERAENWAKFVGLKDVKDGGEITDWKLPEKDFTEQFINKSLMPFYNFASIPGKLNYESTSNIIFTNCHLGERKLSLNEIQFYTKYLPKSTPIPIIIYAGSAHGEQTPMILDMFPDMKMILIDPRFHVIDSQHLAYLYQNKTIIAKDNVDSITKIELVKEPVKRMLHMQKGVAKLRNMALLSLKDTKYPPADVINSNEDLLDQYKEFNANFAELGDKIQSSDKRVFIIQDYITSDLCDKLKTGLNKYKYIFVSDMRTTVGGNGPTDLDILWNHALQALCIKRLKPIATMLKFRPPFMNDEDKTIIARFRKGDDTIPLSSMIKHDFELAKTELGVDYLSDYDAGKYMYFQSEDILLQPWTPIISSETRLIITNPELPFVDYLDKCWDKKFFYYRFYRIFAYHGLYYELLKDDSLNEYCGCIDCAIEIIILSSYLLRNDNCPVDKIAAKLKDPKFKKELLALYNKLSDILFFRLKDNYKCPFHGINTQPPKELIYYSLTEIKPREILLDEIHVGNSTKLVCKLSIPINNNYLDKSRSIPKFAIVKDNVIAAKDISQRVRWNDNDWS